MKIHVSQLVYLDIETYSEIDIRNGLDEYVNHHSFKILCLCYKQGNIHRTIVKEEEMIDALDMFIKEGKKIVSHNALFEFKCLNKIKSIDNSMFICSLLNLMPAGLNYSLKEVLEFLGTYSSFKDRGKELIHKLCIPNKDNTTKDLLFYRDVELRKELLSYCSEDVFALEKIVTIGKTRQSFNYEDNTISPEFIGIPYKNISPEHKEFMLDKYKFEYRIYKEYVDRFVEDNKRLTILKYINNTGFITDSITEDNLKKLVRFDIVKDEKRDFINNYLQLLNKKRMLKKLETGDKIPCVMSKRSVIQEDILLNNSFFKEKEYHTRYTCNSLSNELQPLFAEYKSIITDKLTRKEIVEKKSNLINNLKELDVYKDYLNADRYSIKYRKMLIDYDYYIDIVNDTFLSKINWEFKLVENMFNVELLKIYLNLQNNYKSLVYFSKFYYITYK